MGEVCNLDHLDAVALDTEELFRNGDLEITLYLQLTRQPRTLHCLFLSEIRFFCGENRSNFTENGDFAEPASGLSPTSRGNIYVLAGETGEQSRATVYR